MRAHRDLLLYSSLNCTRERRINAKRLVRLKRPCFLVLEIDIARERHLVFVILRYYLHCLF